MQAILWSFNDNDADFSIDCNSCYSSEVPNNSGECKYSTLARQ